MAATANVIIETKDNVLSVPASAIQNTTGQTTVNILKNGQPQEVSVVTGISSSAQTEIVSGLSEGETVVVQTTTQQGQGSNQGTSPFSTFGGGGGRFIQGR